MALYIEKETDIILTVDYEKIIKEVIDEALNVEACPYEVEISCILTDNQAIKEINLEQRNIDKETDVLSFPLVDFDTPSSFDFLEENDQYFEPDTGELMLGDIIISIEKLIAQAIEYGHSNERELAFLVAHSMLHLFGYDHMTSEDEVVMIEKQNTILNNLGYKRA